MVLPDLTELSNGVIPALTGIAASRSMGEARHAASMAYIGNRAPIVGQGLIQEAMHDARHRLGQPQYVECMSTEMSW